VDADGWHAGDIGENGGKFAFLAEKSGGRRRQSSRYLFQACTRVSESRTVL
jgi:hypothetical protein